MSQISQIIWFWFQNLRYFYISSSVRETITEIRYTKCPKKCCIQGVRKIEKFINWNSEARISKFLNLLGSPTTAGTEETLRTGGLKIASIQKRPASKSHFCSFLTSQRTETLTIKISAKVQSYKVSTLENEIPQMNIVKISAPLSWY